MVNLYALLGVASSASLPEIKRAYRGLVRKCHPDLHPGDHRAEEQLKQLNAAAAILTDPGRRAAYDRSHAGDTTRLNPWPPEAGGDGRDITYATLLSRAESQTGTVRIVHLRSPTGTAYRAVIPIPAGVTTGTQLRVVGLGGATPGGGRRGDLYLHITVAP